MVARFFALFLCAPLFLFSAEFTASVSRDQVNLGESLTLTLTLKDAAAKATPYIEPLITSFIIHSQQQISNTSIVNGKVSASLAWRYVITAKRAGEAIIPSLNIESSEGIIASEPIVIRITKSKGKQNSDSSDENELLLKTTVSNPSPYKNEPIVYTARLSSKQTLVNLQIQKFEIEDAIVEVDGKPQIFEDIVDGKRIGVIEFKYLITPLKSGIIRIPSTVVQGGMPMKRKEYPRSVFDGSIDLMSLMQGFDQYYPFSLVTEEIALDVLPPVADVNPWLPAKALSIEEVWDDNQTFQAGEFFTRGFKIIAEGVNAHQLPSLSEMQTGDHPIKIYGDKPEFFEKSKHGSIRSSRTEQYTLIPQEPGKMVLPEISLAWWNVETKQREVATVPARVLHVLPAADQGKGNQPVALAEQVAFSHAMEEESAFTDEIQKNPMLYIVIAVLALLLIAVIVWVIVLQKKMMRMLAPAPIPKQEKPIVKPKISMEAYAPPKRGKEKLNDLNPT